MFNLRLIKKLLLNVVLLLKKLLLKRHKALQYAVADIIANAVYGHIAIVQAADDIIKLVNAERIIDIDAAKGKDKSDRAVITRDTNGRMIKLVGVNTDAPDELY